MDVLLTPAQFAELYLYLSDKERLGLGPTRGRVTCDHTLRHTIAWLKEHHRQNVRANAEKIVDLGGHCDCEVLLNVGPDSWEALRDEEIAEPDLMGESEWEQFLADVLHDSGYDGGETA